MKNTTNANMARILIGIATILMSAHQAHASEGGGSMGGGGGDNPAPERDSAWFLGEGKTIRYCTEWSTNFGLDLQSAQKEIKTAFETWDNYLTKRKYSPKVLP